MYRIRSAGLLVNSKHSEFWAAGLKNIETNHKGIHFTQSPEELVFRSHYLGIDLLTTCALSHLSSIFPSNRSYLLT